MKDISHSREDRWLYRAVFWNVLGWQALAFVGIYLLFGFIYCFALYINQGGAYIGWDQTLVSYSTRALLTLPVYWLVFVRFRELILMRRLLIHLITLPLFLFSWLLLYHLVCDFFGIFYLYGEGLIWDIYIPFLLYFVQFGFIHFYEYILKSQNQERNAHQLRQVALQSEVNALKAQLQPHFLFNTLNSISASVPPQMERTRELIAKLADTFRFGLQASESETVHLREEISFLKTYLDLEKQRFGARLLPVFRIDEALLSAQVPPMLLQPLVENAIKHGVGNSVDPVEIVIAVRKAGEELEFSVSDTGVGYPNLQTDAIFEKGVGLRNTQMRLEKQFNTRLEVKENQPRGMIFSFYLPTVKKSRIR